MNGNNTTTNQPSAEDTQKPETIRAEMYLPQKEPSLLSKFSEWVMSAVVAGLLVFLVAGLAHAVSPPLVETVSAIIRLTVFELFDVFSGGM